MQCLVVNIYCSKKLTFTYSILTYLLIIKYRIDSDIISRYLVTIVCIENNCALWAFSRYMYVDMDISMDISMDIHGKSVDMDMDMDGKFHIHGKPGNRPISTIWLQCKILISILCSSRLAVDMKFPIHIHIHIHRFSVDIHGYIHIHRCLYMYLLNAHKAQLFSIHTIVTKYRDMISLSIRYLIISN